MADKQRKRVPQEVRASITQMEVAALNFGKRFIQDSAVRLDYISRTRTMSLELLESVRSGSISPQQAAKTANQMRNEIMEMARLRSSDLGRAKAKALKAKGLDLDDLIGKYTEKLFKGKKFADLTGSQQNKVFMEIVEGAGRARPTVNLKAARLGAAGRGLWIFSLLVATYNISVAEDKVSAAGREAAGLAGGFAGGAATGALVGIWAGPVGVAIGVCVGGALGAIMADSAYVELTGPQNQFVRSFLPRFTSFMNVDEQGIADALVTECGIDTRKVLLVFRELDERYSSDADDVALLYVNAAQAIPRVWQAISMDSQLREFLRMSLDAGWTSNAEYQAIAMLK